MAIYCTGALWDKAENVMRTDVGGDDTKMMSPASATGWLAISAAGGSTNRAPLTAMARVPTRSVRI